MKTLLANLIDDGDDIENLFVAVERKDGEWEADATTFDLFKIAFAKDVGLVNYVLSLMEKMREST